MNNRDDEHELERPAFEHHTQRPKFTSRIWIVGVCLSVILGFALLVLIAGIAVSIR